MSNNSQNGDTKERIWYFLMQVTPWGECSIEGIDKLRIERICGGAVIIYAEDLAEHLSIKKNHLIFTLWDMLMDGKVCLDCDPKDRHGFIKIDIPNWSGGSISHNYWG